MTVNLDEVKQRNAKLIYRRIKRLRTSSFDDAPVAYQLLVGKDGAGALVWVQSTEVVASFGNQRNGGLSLAVEAWASKRADQEPHA